jgi:hypothetical protein
MEEPPGLGSAARASQLTRFTEQENSRLAANGVWAARLIIGLGIFCLLFGGLFAAVQHSGHDVAATVTHQGPCTDVCTVHVAYRAVNGRQVTAVMLGVPVSDLYGPARHRLLNIKYQSADGADPTTNDMPSALWIGFLGAGVIFGGLGVRARRRQKKRMPASGPVVGLAPASGAVAPAATLSGPTGAEAGKAEAATWAPLPGTEQQWQNAAVRVRRARTSFLIWLAATLAAAAITVLLYARDLSNSRADFTSAVVALVATAWCVISTLQTRSTWTRRRRVERAGRAAAGSAGAGQGPAQPG